MSNQGKRFYNFGPYTLDSESLVLYCGNDVVAIAPRVVETLLVLVQNAGRVLDRQELISRVWGKDGGEESHLSRNIHTLRQHLSEGSDEEGYIRTVPTKGYCFRATVTLTSERSPTLLRHVEPQAPQSPAPAKGPLDASPAGGAVPARAGEPSGPRWTDGATIHDKIDTAPEIREGKALPYWRWAVTFLAVCLAVIATYVGERWRHPPQPRVPKPIQLTHDNWRKPGTPLVTDGPQIYFRELANGQRTASVSAGGGDSVPEPSLFGFDLSDISPDGSEFLATKPGAEGEASQIWIVPVRGAAPRSLGGLRGEEPAWSPDGTQIVYHNAHSLFVARNDGSDPRLLTTVAGFIFQPRWSPEGRVLRFTHSNLDNDESTLWEVRADGTNPRTLSGRWSNPRRECWGRWTSDGKYFVFSYVRDGGGELWARQEKCAPFFWECGRLFPLAQGPISYEQPLPDRDSKRVFAIGTTKQSQLERYDLPTRSFVPYAPLEGIPATQLDFTRDGKWMAYVDSADHTLWRSRLDGSEKIQLTSPRISAAQPHWSRDGKQIAFMSEGDFKVCLVSADGGPVVKLLPGNEKEGVPTWSSDGKRLAFGEPLSARKPEAMTIHLVDLDTHQQSTLPDSNGLWTARWSPNGRYIVAMVVGKKEGFYSVCPELRLFDFNTQKWTTLAKIDYLEEPTWSRDSQYVYFHALYPDTAIFRLRIADRRLEQLANLKGISRIVDNWTGVAPDGSPMIVHDTLIQEIYTLGVDWP
ncbi:MAG TPA: winged helix-turn-helix domain-containing protein [Terriglobia bacterium]|nr:winged helix-turn-helix domain-containing protein [Terriglobia bacterium]